MEFRRHSRSRRRKRSHEQVIDEITQDELLQAGYDAHALEKAQALITNFKEFIEQHKEELEAIQILYSRPHRAGLRFRQVKDLAAALKNPPVGASTERVWQAYEATEPHAVKGKGGRDVVRKETGTSLISTVREGNQPQSHARKRLERAAYVLRGVRPSQETMPRDEFLDRATSMPACPQCSASRTAIAGLGNPPEVC